MRKVLRSGALALVGLAAAAAPVMAATACPAGVCGGSVARHLHATAGTPAAPGHIVPGLYHVPIIGKQVLPGLGSLLGGERHATAVSSANWAGYADTNDTYTSVSSSWTEPAVSCSSSGGGLSLGFGGLTGIFRFAPGRPRISLGVLGRPRRLLLDERRADRHGLGLRLGHAVVLRLVRDVPQPLGHAADRRRREPR